MVKSFDSIHSLVVQTRGMHPLYAYMQQLLFHVFVMYYGIYTYKYKPQIKVASGYLVHNSILKSNPPKYKTTIV